MQKKLSLAAFALLSLFCSSQHTTQAQAEVPRFEVGGHFTSLSLSDFETTEPGVGGRLAYNVTNNIALEAEINVFPREREFEGGQKVQGLFGTRIGVRRERFGLFGKVRPGFVRFNNLMLAPGPFACPGGICQTPPPPPQTFSETNFALDIGGVVELYPSRRTIIRFDVGDTIIRSNSDQIILIPFSESPLVPQSFIRSTSNNLQISVGIGFRF